jgi:sugar phosphate isomerase/epimerase
MSERGRLGLGTYAFRWSIGIRDRIPPSPMTPLQVVDEAVAAGLDLVQFADNLPLHGLADAEIDTLGRHAAGRGVALELGIQGFDPALVRRYLDMCARLGAELLRIAFDAEDARKDVPDLVAELRPLLPACRAAGVRLAIENHFHVPSAKLAEVVAAVDDERLGICLDVANSICAHEWPEDTVTLLAPYAINLHLKDYRMEPDPYGVGFRVTGVVLGEGALDTGMVFAALERHGRKVNVVLEQWLPLQDDPERTARLEREWIRRSALHARQRMG